MISSATTKPKPLGPALRHTHREGLGAKGLAPAQDAGGMAIAELASHLGTTVRALRYYEDEQVFVPHRDARNARRYGPEARLQAQAVVALRRAQVPLSTIKAVILGEQPQAQLEAVLKERLCEARAHVADIETLIASSRSGALLASAECKGTALPNLTVREAQRDHSR